MRYFILHDGTGLRVRNSVPLFAWLPNYWIVESFAPNGRRAEEGRFRGGSGEMAGADLAEHRRREEEASSEAMRFARSFLCDESTELTADAFASLYPSSRRRGAA